MNVGNRSCLHATDGTILFVGGPGPNNYTKIQDAIANSTDGDTVYVYDDSSPYYEHVIIDKSIELLGENKNTTVIDGENTGDVVVFSADNITLSGFTIQNSGDTPKVDAGVESRSNGDIISDNSIIQNGQYAVGILLNGSSNNLVTDNFISENGNEGIFLEKATHCIIRNNVITRNGHCAIVISRSTRNTIVENTMYDNYATVSFWSESTENEVAWNLMRNQEYSGIGIWPGANNNSIHHNYLSNNSLYGFIITRAQGNVIMNNTIWGSNEGMRLNMANKTIIKFNNFIENNISVFFENSSFNRWKQNYWDDHHGRWPKCIRGMMRIPWNKTIVIHWINLDWFPSSKPYDIPLFGGEMS
jgi:parallel beta-helix repeat protein